jgi:aspartate racemase
LESLRRLENSADFAVMACNTAHAFLPELQTGVQLPILDVVREVARELVRKGGNQARVGLLATSGTLRAGIYQETARSWAAGLSWISLQDLDGGDRLQEELVMQSVYGKVGGSRGGLKAGYRTDPNTGQPYADQIRLASDYLLEAGADIVVLGCTEIPLALEGEPPLSVPTLDPMEVAAEAALRIAAGDVELPSVHRDSHPVRS